MESKPVDSRFDGMKPLQPTDNLDKKTSRVYELQRLLQYRFKFDVVEELLKLYADPDTKNSDRRQILEALMSRLYPQLKAMEIDTRDGEKICVNIVFPEDKKDAKVEVTDAA